MESPRVTKFTMASAATSTDTQFVGYGKRFLVISNVTGFNAGTGNIAYSFSGHYDKDATALPIPAATLTTSSNGIYGISGCDGVPYLKVAFGTAVTGGTANTIYLITADDS